MRLVSEWIFSILFYHDLKAKYFMHCEISSIRILNNFSEECGLNSSTNLLALLIIIYLFFFLVPHHTMYRNFRNRKNFRLQFLANLHVLGSGESKKKHQISMVSGSS